ncbi:TMEM175 family protein [Halosimplex pelagicum]|uniref:DUF1211 domain-containing protein n=1 Tax=Halosimplex pelagicum TaxID=869886 RepID=A0A7D5T662_9EURY|nr:TMEM175 family protein [Halosimplex pelagicum]QLH82988.1 DUF1211 domain-containing protein [Halosimplex pelagicum]
MALTFRGETEETDRLLALSDGVVAIAITLLVLDFSVPEVPPGASSATVETLVFDQWDEFVGYALSFPVIGLYWTLHRRVFVHIEEHDRGVLWLNLFFLFFVAFVPYGTSVFSAHPDRFGVSFVAGVLALTGLSLALLWVYASRKRLLEAGLASRAVRIQAARFLVSPLVFALSIGVAALDARLGILTWALLVPINAALNSRLVEGIEAESDAAGEPGP